jgi:ornithine--oxo-acid transaminase
VPFDDVKSVEEAIDENTVGVLMEPIQAEAGILIPKEGYLQKLRDLCTSKGVLLIWDEIQTGLARTGKNFCYEYERAKPDVLILGKSLGGGLLPISAVVAKKEVMDVIKPGQHGSTFGGNPLACAVARETLKLMKKENFSQKAERIGALVKEAFQGVKSPLIKEIRGKGALIGIELYESAGGARKYTEKLAEKGILCKETHDHVIRIAPPLVIKEADLKAALHLIREVLQ